MGNEKVEVIVVGALGIHIRIELLLKYIVSVL
jgi:hypothetical protein